MLALATLSACSSKPSARQVVRDTIGSLEANGYLDEAQQACMLAKLEGYSDDQLDNIANENENWNPAGGSTMEQASPSMQLFIADYAGVHG